MEKNSLFELEAQKKIAELELKIKLLENEKLINQVITESSLDLICTASLKGYLKYLNKSWTDVLEWTFEELRSRPFLDFVHPDDRKLTLAAANKLSKGKPIKLFENRYRTKSGKYRWLSWNTIPIVENNLMVGIARDITESKKNLEELKQKSEFIQTVLDNLPIGVALNKFNEGNTTYINDKFSEIYGWSKQDLSDVNLFFERVYPDKKYREEIINRVMEDIQSGDASRMHWENIIITQRNGDKRIINARNIPLINQNTMVSTVIDITDLKEYERELLIAKEKAEQADRLKSAFLANMSHEIRTPMNGIIGFTNLLKDTELSGDEHAKFIEIIQKSGERMLHTVNSILEISRIETGQVEVSIQETDVNSILVNLYEFFKVETRNKNLTLRLDNLLPTNFSIITTDKNKLESILTNLIKNAIKFTIKGHISFGCQKKNKELEFYVEDTGIGIPQDRYEAIFNQFEQADVDDSLALQGSGLGLSISKSYVEMLGGKIWLESNKGKGSRFYFTLPFNPTQPLVSSENTDIQDFVLKNKLKILIVEDDNVSYLHLSLLLKDLTSKILHAQNGEEAVRLCRENSDLDLILMDMKLPLMNGFEATKQIRKFNRNLPIIAQTAYALEGDKEKTINAGCNDYISKPIQKESLIKLISKLSKKKDLLDI